MPPSAGRGKGPSAKVRAHHREPVASSLFLLRAGLPGLPEVTPPGEAGIKVSRYIINLMVLRTYTVFEVFSFTEFDWNRESIMFFRRVAPYDWEIAFFTYQRFIGKIFISLFLTSIFKVPETKENEFVSITAKVRGVRTSDRGEGKLA